jgi:hypothetical protein
MLWLSTQPVITSEGGTLLLVGGTPHSIVLAGDSAVYQLLANKDEALLPDRVDDALRFVSAESWGTPGLNCSEAFPFLGVWQSSLDQVPRMKHRATGAGRDKFSRPVTPATARCRTCCVLRLCRWPPPTTLEPV